MEIKLIRSDKLPNRTFGQMHVNGSMFAQTLEDANRFNLPIDHPAFNCNVKIRNKTAIPEGRYEVVLTYSNRFKKYLPLLLNVPCFDAIRIHGGNTEDDTEGCVLIGEYRDANNKIYNCASKVQALVTAIKAVEKKEKVFITIS